MREVVVKTPRKLLGPNIAMIGLPLIIIMIFCSAYIGLKMQATRTSRNTSSLTSDQSNDPLLPTLPVQQADLLESVSPLLVVSPLADGVTAPSDTKGTAATGTTQPTLDTTAQGNDTGLTNELSPSSKPAVPTKTDKSKDHKKTDSKKSKPD